MKKRLLPYLVFLPIILLIAYTDIDIYLKYLAIASIPLSIGLIVYMFIKSSAYYRAKKVLLFFIFALGLLVPIASAYAQTPMASMQARRRDQINYESEVKSKEAQKLARHRELKKTIEEIGRIPKEQRSKEQQKKYEDAKKEFVKLNKELNIKPGCSTTQELLEEVSDNCWACDVANLFIEGADKVAINFYRLDKKNGISKSLLVLGLFGWILIHVLKLLMTFGHGDIGAFFTDLFLKLLLVGGIFILLSFPIQGVVNFAISPIFTLSSTLGQEIGKRAELSSIPENFSTAPSISSEQAAQIQSNLKKTLKTDRCKYCIALDKGDETQDKIISEEMGHTAKPEERVVSGSMRNSLLCSVCSVYKATVQPTVVGQYLLCNAKNRTSKFKNFIPKAFYTDWDAVIAGVFLIVAFFSVAGIFSFYMIDTFFRVAIVLTLMPLLIVAAAFKSTLNYTKKGFEIIIHAFFTYVILSLFMMMIIQLYYHFLGGEATDVLQLAFTNDYDKLREAVSFRISGRIVVYSVALALFVYLLLKNVDEYISSISGISLNNSNGAKAFDSARTTVGAGIGFVSAVYSRKWEGGAGTEDNSIQKRAAKIRKWGEKRTWLEKRIDQGLGSVTKKGLSKANKLIKEGHKFRGRMAKIGIVTGAFTAKHLSHIIIRTAALIPKAIARNKYFNKTIGLLWQAGKDVGDVGKASKRGYNYLAPKVAAKMKYFKKPKK